MCQHSTHPIKMNTKYAADIATHIRSLSFGCCCFYGRIQNQNVNRFQFITLRFRGILHCPMRMPSNECRAYENKKGIKRLMKSKANT